MLFDLIKDALKEYCDFGGLALSPNNIQYFGMDNDSDYLDDYDLEEDCPLLDRIAAFLSRELSELVNEDNVLAIYFHGAEFAIEFYSGGCLYWRDFDNLIFKDEEEE